METEIVKVVLTTYEVVIVTAVALAAGYLIGNLVAFLRHEDPIVKCGKCRYWGHDGFILNGCRPCHKLSDSRFIDGSDSLYTEPVFGCVDGELR